MINDMRLETRFNASRSQPVRVRQETNGTVMPGVLLDLSQSGLRLRLNACLHEGEDVLVCIPTADPKSPIPAAATVRWASADGTHWLIGCALKERLDKAHIEEMLSLGELDRAAARQPASLITMAKPELGLSFETIQIIDISEGGFRAFGESLAVQQNDRLMLKTAEPSDTDGELVRARVVWVRDMENGRTIGCEFLAHQDYGCMQKIARKMRAVESPIDSDQQTTPDWSMVGTAAAMFILVFQQYYL